MSDSTDINELLMEGIMSESMDDSQIISIDDNADDEGSPTHMGFLLDAIHQHHAISEWGQSGLKFTDDYFMQKANIEYLDYEYDVDIVEVEGVIYWSFNIPEYIGESVSVTTSRETAKNRQRYTIRHDFVSAAVHDGVTDIRLQEVYGEIGDEDDVLTPDFHLLDPSGNHHWIEVTTSRVSDLNHLRNIYDGKRFKYQIPLQTRSHECISTLTIIVVAENLVMSTVRLPQKLVNDLIVRMHIASLLENLARARSIQLIKTESETVADIMAEDIIRKTSKIGKIIPKKNKCPLTINEKFYESCLTPPDTKEAMSAFVTSFGVAAVRSEIEVNPMSKVTEYLSKCAKVKNCRDDMKPVASLPFIDCETTESDLTPRPVTIGICGKHGPLADLWNMAFSEMSANGTWKEEDVAKLEEEALEMRGYRRAELEKERASTRRDYHRVDLRKSLDRNTMTYLNMDGVMAKSAQNNIDIIIRKASQKRTFSWDTSTSDIEKFLECTTHLEKSVHPQSASNKNIIRLLTKAEHLADNSKMGTTLLQKWMNTSLYRKLDLMSEIALELSISLKQNTTKGEFILKKLRYYNAYLLIKPTNSRSHIFYSVYFPKGSASDDVREDPFKPLIGAGRGCVMPFSSIRADKLENVASASANLFSLVSFWSDFYGVDDMSPENISGKSQLIRMLLVTILVSLEDKAETEESITLTRYMYMEIFKTGNLKFKPNPFKIISKMRTNIRSRLNLWVIHKIIENFSLMISNPPTRSQTLTSEPIEDDDDALPGDEWTGLINFFTGAQVRSATAVVNLMYVGYFKNKNETAQGNSDWKLLEKILEEEFSVRQDEEGLRRSQGGLKGMEVPGNKEFSLECIKFGSSILEHRLLKMKGEEWKKEITNEIGRNLARQLSHTIATLKASSTFKPTDVEKIVEEKDADIVKRVKVIEAIGSMLGRFGLNPFINLEDFIKSIEEESGGIVSDLFKKNQHGGLREIYVLDIESRIPQLFLEVVSRTLCSNFENEILTHPKNKIKILDQHKTNSYKKSKRCRTYYTELCSSSDKQRWNQNLELRALSVAMFRMTDSCLHGAILRCLNLWTNKFIKIPPGVCKLLLNHVELSSDVYSELLSKFWGRRPAGSNSLGIHKPLSQFINTSTGMMQGILHYTSSLLHLCFLAAGSQMVLARLTILHPHNSFEITQVCSSDDSATILSIHSDEDPTDISEQTIQAVQDSEICLHALTNYCKYFCMRESDKSAIAMQDYVEFNSEFLFKNTVAVPVIKFVGAATNMTESISMIDRFYNQYNLLSDLFSSGLPASNTHLIQLSQGIMHYKALGVSTNALFPVFLEKLISFPSPTYGFFLLDSELCPGLMGYGFSHWLAITRDDKLYKNIGVMNWTSLTVSGSGEISESLQIHHGDSKRWFTMLERISKGRIDVRGMESDCLFPTSNITVDKNRRESLLEIIEENSMLLYRHPETLPELRIKLLVKASMPGVQKSLSNGNPFIQALSSSVYGINTHSFTGTIVKMEYDEEKNRMMRVRKTEKKSLLLALNDRIKMVEEIEDDVNNEDHLLVLFPAVYRYQDAKDVINSFDSSRLVPSRRLRQRKSTIVVQPRSASLPLTLLQTVCHKWFNFTIKVSKNAFNRCWQEYKLDFPWLELSYEETELSCPFGSKLELFGFLSAQSTRTRAFVRNGPSIKSMRFATQLSLLIGKCNKRNHILKKDRTLTSSPEELDGLMTHLSLALSIPLHPVRKDKVQMVLENIYATCPNVEETGSQPRHLQSATLLAHFHKKSIGSQRLIDHLKSLGKGMIATYNSERRQAHGPSKKSWTGRGELLVLKDGILLRLTLEDREVVTIQTNKWPILKANAGVLREVMREFNLGIKPGYGMSERLVAKFHSGRFVPPNMIGVPVIISEDMIQPSLEDQPLYFKVKLRRCGVYTYIKGIELPVLEYRTNLKDVSLMQGQKTKGNDIWDYWINQTSAPLDLLCGFVNDVHKRIKSISVPQESKDSMREWVDGTLKNRLKQKGLGFISTNYAASIDDGTYRSQIDADLDLMKFIEESGFLVEDEEGLKAMGLGGFGTSDIGEEVSMTDHEKLEKALRGEFQTDDVECDEIKLLFSNWNQETRYEDVTIRYQQAFSYLYLHPFWDNFIEACNTLDRSFFNSTMHGIISVKDEILSKKLMTILGIKEVKKELNITQRFGQAASSADYDYWWEYTGKDSQSMMSRTDSNEGDDT